MTPAPTTIIHRWSNEALELTCCHPDPSVPATWELRRLLHHPYEPPTSVALDGGTARNMDEALTAGLSAAGRFMEDSTR